MSRISNHLVTKAKFTPRYVTSSSDRIRMRWSVRNISKGEVRVIGYSCPFYFEGEPMGVYITQSGQWDRKERMISNNHIITVLRPKELRTYEWEYVVPQYYGITKPGKWSYCLKIYYEVFGRSGRFISKAEPALVELEEPILVLQKERWREAVYYDILSNDWQSILGYLEGVALKIPYLGEKPISCLVQKRFSTDKGPVDYLASCESLTILTEVKLKPVHVVAIRKLIEKKRWYIDVYRPFVSRNVSDVWGLVICPKASRGAIGLASQNQVQIVLTTFEKGNLVFESAEL